MKHQLIQTEGAGGGLPAVPMPRSGRQEARADESEGILFALAQAVEQRDSITAGHCEGLALTSLALGVGLCLDRPSLLALYRGGYLHDIGKVGIPDSILFKPGPLTAEEWVVMRSHPARGEEICRHVKSFVAVLPIIRHHHERWDGSGYPDGLRGEQIPLLARVLQIVDIYDALTNPRPYKPAYTAKQALRVIEEETACGWRDPEIVQVFFNIHSAVIVKVAEYSRRDECDLEAMRVSLTNLNQAFQPGVAPSSLDLDFLDNPARLA
jgi:HD-GYP domain-containing protein (c-di-GMP phosphodiesterase class II)